MDYRQRRLPQCIDALVLETQRCRPPSHRRLGELMIGVALEQKEEVLNFLVLGKLNQDAAVLQERRDFSHHRQLETELSPQWQPNL